MTIKEKLEKYDLFDQAIIRHGMMDYIRDYEVIGYISGLDYDLEVQYLFKGCLRVNHKLKVDPKSYSMDDRLLSLDNQDNLNYPKGFIWGVKYAVVYPGLTINENREELNALSEKYKLKFYELLIETNAYDLILIFHDIETKILNRINKGK